MDIRDTFFTILLGTNGTGKTTFLAKMIETSANSGRRVLILTPDAVEWQEYPEISVNEIPGFEGVAKIVYYPGLFDKMLKYFYSGFLVLDDFKSFAVKNKEYDTLQKILVRRRQHEIDLALVVHGFTQVVPLFLYNFATHLIIFRTLDNIKRVLHTMPDPVSINESVERVNKKAVKEPHYFEIFSLK